MGTVIIGGRLVAGDGLDAGEITVRAIPAGKFDVELPLNGDGTIDIEAILPMVDPVTKSRVDLPALLIPGRDFIGVVVDGVIVEAGPIWTDPFTWPQTTRIVGSGLWSYFDHRHVLPVLTPGQLPRDVVSTWTGLSRRTLVKRLVQQACSHPASGLPIDYEPDIAGADELSIPGSDLKPVGEALRDLTEIEGGPEIAFRPKWGADRKHVRWDLLTGDPEITQAGDDHYWDVSVPDAHAKVIRLTRDGGGLTSRDFQIGSTIRNLWGNSSFEEGLDGVGLGTNATALINPESSPFHGAKYAGWSSVGAGGSYLSATRSVAVEEGEWRTFSAHVRASFAAQVAVMIRFKDASGMIYADIVGGYKTASTTGWVRPHVSAQAPAGATSCDVHIVGIATSGGQSFAADGLMLTEGEDLYPFAEDSITLQATATDPSLTDAGFPLLESVTNRSSVTREAVLQLYSTETVVRGSAHLQTWEITARRGKHPRLGTYWPGDYAKIRIGKNARVPADTYRVRIIGFAFNKTGDVSLRCAPERVVSGYPVPSTSRTWFRDKLRSLAVAIAETTRGS